MTDVSTAGEAGVGGLTSRFLANDEAVKEKLSLKELKERKKQQEKMGGGSRMASTDSGSSAVPRAPEPTKPSADLPQRESSWMKKQPSASGPLGSAARMDEMLANTSTVSESPEAEQQLTEQELAVIREQREKEWAKEKEEYEKLIQEKEIEVKDWTKKVREAESQQRVKNRRKVVKPKKVKLVEDYIESDLYGRGFNGIFGKYGEDATVKEAAMILERTRNKKAHVKDGDHVDYDLYGRADPRIFGEGAHIESKRQAAEASLKKQQEAALKPKKNRLKFPVGNENYYRNFEGVEKNFLLRADSMKMAPKKQEVLETTDDVAQELVDQSINDVIANNVFDLAEVEMQKEAEFVAMAPVAEVTATPIAETAAPTAVPETPAAAEHAPEVALAAAAGAGVAATGAALAMAPPPEKSEEFEKKKEAEYAAATEDNVVADQAASTAFKDKFKMFDQNAANDVQVQKKAAAKDASPVTTGRDIKPTEGRTIERVREGGERPISEVSSEAGKEEKGEKSPVPWAAALAPSAPAAVASSAASEDLGDREKTLFSEKSAVHSSDAGDLAGGASVPGEKKKRVVKKKKPVEGEAAATAAAVPAEGEATAEGGEGVEKKKKVVKKKKPAEGEAAAAAPAEGETPAEGGEGVEKKKKVVKKKKPAEGEAAAAAPAEGETPAEGGEGVEKKKKVVKKKKPVEGESAAAHPAEAAPVEAAHVEATPVEAAHVEATPVEAAHVEATPVEAAHVEAPAEASPIEAAAEEGDVVEKKPKKKTKKKVAQAMPA